MSARWFGWNSAVGEYSVKNKVVLEIRVGVDVYVVKIVFFGFVEVKFP